MKQTHFFGRWIQVFEDKWRKCQKWDGCPTNGRLAGTWFGIPPECVYMVSKTLNVWCLCLYKDIIYIIAYRYAHVHLPP